MNHHIDDVKDLARIIQRRRPDWQNLGPIYNAIVELAKTHPMTVLLGRLPEAATNPTIRTPAGLTYLTFADPTVTRGEGGNDNGPRCAICQKTRTRHDHAESVVPERARHDFQPKEPK